MTAVKTAISLDEDLLRQIDDLAVELEQPRSRVLARAAEEFLRRRESRRILKALNQAHSTADDAEFSRRKELRQARHRALVEGEW